MTTFLHSIKSSSLLLWLTLSTTTLFTGVSFGQTNNCNDNAPGQITVGTSCSPAAFNSTNNSDYWDGATGCNAADRDDAWGWFDATSTLTTITFTPSATDRDPILTLFTGNCNANMSSIDCADSGSDGDPETIVYATTIGTRYRIRIQDWNSDEDMNGTICVYNGSSSTTYCEPTTENPEFVYIDDVSFVGTLNDVSNLNTGYANGYQDFTALSNIASQLQGEGVNIYAESNGVQSRWKAWVDWNNDGVFAASEIVYNPGAFGGPSVNFGFVIPDATTPGDYRIRIRNLALWDNWLGDFSWGYNYDACEDFEDEGIFSYDYNGEAEDYLFTVIENCAAQVLTVTNDDRCNPGSLTLIATGTAGSSFNWYDSETGGTFIENNAGTFTTPSIATTTTYYVTATNGGCESIIRVPVVATIFPTPTVTFSPSTPVICGDNDIITLIAGGDFETVYLIDEDFESGNLGDFSNVNNDANGGAVDNNTRWINRVSTYIPIGPVWKPAVASGFGDNNFVMSTSDVTQSPVNNPIENSLILTNAVNSEDFVDLTLTMKLYFSRYLPNNDTFYDEYVNVEVTTDGTTWTPIANIIADVGIGTNFAELTFPMTAYVDNTNLRIRVRYHSWSNNTGWLPGGVAVDDIKLFGQRPLSTAFNYDTSVIDAFTDISCLPAFAYVPNTPATQIFIKPTLLQLQNASFNIPVSATLSNGCSATGSVVINNNTRVWNGTTDGDWNVANNWLPNDVPTADNCVIIRDNGTSDPTIGIPFPPNPGFARNLTVLNGGFLELQTDTNLTVTDWINVQPNGIFSLKNSASLVQVLDITTRPNTGNIHVQRAPKSDFSAVGNLNYVYWSSPVENFNIQQVSPNTANNLRWHWIPSVPGNGDGDHGDWQNASGTMVEGKGYIIRGLSGTPTVIPTTSYPVSNNTALFSGVPNNGEIKVDISRGTWTTADYEGIGNTATVQDDNWNLLGNPYPSSISANDFVTLNTNINGTIYLWPHESLPGTYDDPFYEDYVLNYDNEYIEHNPTGTIPPTVGDVYIASGQSFMVLMEDSSASTNETVIFNNSLREGSQPNTNFYRQSDNTSNNIAERHRIWLDLVKSNNKAHTLLVGYVENATNDVDRLYEGYSNIETTTSFYSLIDETTFSIQGRALPFSQEDMVPLGIKVSTNDLFKIGINTLDGLFENENQPIYLEDKYLSIIHDLRNSPYTFSANSGTYNDRFILRYTSETLDVNDPELNSGLNIIAYDNEIKVTSINNPINSIEVYDILGRTIATHKDVNVTEFKFNLSNISNGTFIVKATLYNGQQKVKKIVH